MERGPAYLVASRQLGEGEHELGEKLLGSFLYTLLEAQPCPTAIAFVNEGIWLTTEPGPILDTVARLVERGIAILSCGTCLDYYERTDRLLVGRVSNMYEISEVLARSGAVRL